MNASIQSVFFLLIISGSIYGQTDAYSNIENNINKDLSIPYEQFKDHKIYFFKVNKSGDTIIFQKIDPYFDLQRHSFPSHHDKIESYSDSIREKQYPGSSKFYAKSKIQPLYNQKAFIIKPDPFTQRHFKHYLIIEDPIIHKRTN